MEHAWEQGISDRESMARSKSQSSAELLSLMSRFSGLMSRWMRPWACMAASAVSRGRMTYLTACTSDNVRPRDDKN